MDDIYTKYTPLSIKFFRKGLFFPDLGQMGHHDWGVRKGAQGQNAAKVEENQAPTQTALNGPFCVNKGPNLQFCRSGPPNKPVGNRFVGNKRADATAFLGVTQCRPFPNIPFGHGFFRFLHQIISLTPLVFHVEHCSNKGLFLYGFRVTRELRRRRRVFR